MQEKLIRRHLIFTGVVQGVGFRWRARQAANAAGCTGWVRNDYTGTVSMELQGTEARLDQVLRTLERAPWIRIEDINSRLIPVEPDERGFVTRDDEW
jgi:acylphosphatase